MSLVGEASFVTPMQTYFVVAAVGGIVMAKQWAVGQCCVGGQKAQTRKRLVETKLAGKSAVNAVLLARFVLLVS